MRGDSGGPRLNGRLSAAARGALAAAALLALTGRAAANVGGFPDDQFIRGLSVDASSGAAGVRERVEKEAVRYCAVEAFDARDPAACSLCAGFKHSRGEIDSASGEVGCRRLYAQLRVQYAFNAGEPGALKTCLEDFPLNQIPRPEPEEVSRICGWIADSFARSIDSVCVDGLPIGPAACRQRLGERHGLRAACARLQGDGVTERREICAATAAFHDVVRAGRDAKLCGGSEFCRLFIGEGPALLASYAEKIRALAAGGGEGSGDEGGARAPDSGPPLSDGPMTVAQALNSFADSNLDEPSHEKDSEEVVDLGRHLFFDKRLSLHRDFSCASCHRQELGWSDGLPRGRGAGGLELPRRTLSLLKVGYYGAFMWDGRAPTLEDQVLMPLQSPAEMGIGLDELSRRLAEVPQYRERFAKAFGAEGATKERIAASLAAFVRRIGAEQDESRFERFQRDRTGLSAAQRRGFLLFMGKAACVKCHIGRKLTYGAYLNTGVADPPDHPDAGRFGSVPVEGMRGAFRTPTLFNAALTPPYMHNGSLKTLRDVVEFYNRGGDDKERRSAGVRSLSLTPSEIGDLTAFLGALVRRPHHIPVPEDFPAAPPDKRP